MSDFSPYVGQTVGIQLRMSNNTTSGSRPFSAGFNLKATSGSLSEFSSTIQEPVSNEITHTNTTSTSSSVGSGYGEKTWGTTSTSSVIRHTRTTRGSTTFYYCVNGGNSSAGSTSATSAGDSWGCSSRTITYYNRPTISGVDGTTTYTEGGASVAIDSFISLTDDFDLSLNRAEVQISSGYVSGQDVLVCPSTSLSCSVSGSQLTLTGTASTTTYDAALQAVRYQNTSSSPNTSTRTVRMRIRDTANNYSLYDSKFIAVRDKPTLSGSIGQVNTYNEGGTGTVVDTTVTIVDNDSSSMNRAEVQISVNRQTTDLLSCSSCGTLGLSPSYSTSTGTLTITGTTSKANYELALESVRFSSSSQEPSELQRTIRFRVRDTNNNYSDWDPTQFNVNEINDTPTTNNTVNAIAGFTEDGSPVTIDSVITISDNDTSQLLNRAEVQISANYQDGADVLACPVCATLGLSTNWDISLNGTLIITGSAARSTYETALESVTFDTTSQEPGTSRTVRFRVRDAANSFSVYDSTTINVTARNDVPSLNNSVNAVASFTEDGAPVTIDAAISISDNDTSQSIDRAEVQMTTNYQDGADVLACPSCASLGLSVNWDSTLNGTLVITGTGTRSAYELALESVTFDSTSQEPGSSRTVQFRVRDTGGDYSNYDATSINVIAVNDQPTTGNTFSAIANFTEDGIAVVVDSAITISDNDTSQSLNRAEVQMTTNYQDGLDVLACPACAGQGLSVNWDSSLNGTLVITGTGSRSSYEAALESVTFDTTSQQPGTSRTLRVRVRDTLNSFSAYDTTTIGITEINDQPTLGSTVNSIATFTEDGAAVVIDNLITISDNDTTQLLNRAEVQMTTNYQDGSDVLACPTCAGQGLSADWDNTLNGTLVITGSATRAAYELALESVTFDSASQDPGSSRTVRMRVRDAGNSFSSYDPTTINVNSVNDAPVISAYSGSLAYTENAGALVLDSNLGLSDAESHTISSAELTITSGYRSGEDTLSCASDGTITCSWNQTLGKLTLSGTTSLLNYQSRLRSVTYINSEEAPNTTPRTVELTVTDTGGVLNGGQNSDTANKSITITAVNDAPVISNFSGTLVYNEGSNALTLDGDVGLSDQESDNIVSATLQITNNYVNGEDVLACETGGGISCSFNPTNGTLTLSGAASLAAYALKLQSVTYSNADQAPTDSNRTVLLTVTDVGASGGANDNDATASKLINVNPVNDAPTAASFSVTTDEDSTYLFNSGLFGFNDVDGDSFTSLRIETLPVNGDLFDDGIAITSVPTVLPVADIATLSYQPDPQENGNAYASFQFDVVDSSASNNTSNGNYVATIDVDAVADAPTSASDSISAVEDTNYVFSAGDFVFDDDDGDSLQAVLIESLPAAGDLLYNGSSVTGGQLPFTASNLSILAFRADANENGNGYASFQFEVIDEGSGNNTSQGNYQMTVNVSQINDAPVIDTNSNASVAELGSVNLSAANLSASDIDDVDAGLLYTVSSVPSRGVLRRGAVTLSNGSTFTQADLNSSGVSYTQTSNAGDPSADSFVFSLTDPDGAGPTGQSFTIDITLNTAPTINAGGTLNYGENDPATAISNITITDADADDIASATVQITGAYQSNQDVLSFADTASISGSFNSGNGTLTLTGTDSIADYQTALGNVEYSNTSEDPVETARTVTFIVTDDFGNASAGATATVNVARANDPPTSADNTVATAEDTVYDFDGSEFGFSDEDSSDSLSAVVITSLPANGTLKLSTTDVTAGQSIPQASLTDLNFTPEQNQSGTPYTSFTFRVNDGSVSSDAAYTLTINVAADNDVPVIDTNSNASVEELGQVTLTSSNLSASDVEDSNSSLTYTLVSAPSNGILRRGVTVLGNGASFTQGDINGSQISYTQTDNAGAPLSDSFTFDLSDSQGAGPDGVSFTIDITLNSAPSVTAGATLMFTEGDADTAIGAVTVSDTDADAIAGASVAITGNYQPEDTLVFSNQSGITGTWSAGSGILTLTGPASAGSFETALSSVAYSNASEDPNEGDRTVTYVVTDDFGNVSASATATIEVTAQNDTPTEVSNSGITLTASTSVTITTSDLEYTDIEDGAAALIYKIGAGPGALPTLGTLFLDGSPLGNGSEFTQQDIDNSLLSYTAGAVSGSDEFHFSVKDSGLATVNAQVFNITVSNNAPPAVTAGGTLNYAENQAATVIDGTVTITDSDNVELQGATVQLTNNYADDQDVLAFSTQNGITGSFDAGNGRMTLSGTASLADYETAIESITYVNTSEDPSTAPRTVSYRVTDAFGNTSSAATASINVSADNDAPTASNNTLTTDEDVTKNILAADFGFSDPDSADSLQSVRIVSVPAQGALKLGAATVTAGADVAVSDLLGNLKFEPVADQNGSPYTSFTFRVSDGTVLSAATYTMTIDVDAVNDAPVLDTNATLAVGELLSASITGSFLSSSDVDDTDGNITYTVTSAPAYGTLSSSAFTQAQLSAGSISYTNTVAGQTSDSFTFQIKDDENAGPVSLIFNISITQNQPAILTAGGALAYTENDPATAIDSTIAISDADDTQMQGASVQISGNYVGTEDVLAFAAQNGITVASNSGGTLTLTGTTSIANYITALRSVTYANTSEAPDENQRTVSFTVTDAFGNVSAAATATIDVTATNDAPEASDNTLSTDEDTDLSLLAADFGFSDVDGDSLSAIRISSLPASGVLRNGATPVSVNDDIPIADLAGNLVFEPAANENGTAYASFGFRVDDGTDLSDVSYTITVDVDAINDAPSLDINTGLSTKVSTVRTITAAMLSSSDIEDDASAIDYTVTGLPTLGSLSLTTFTQQDLIDGNLTYTAGATSGADSFSFDVDDSAGEGPTAQSFAISISDNDPPVLTAGAVLNYTENDAASVIDNTVTITDTDDAQMQGASVQISNNFASGEDVLAFAAQNGITVQSNTGGTLVLTGSADIADYVAALRSVTYANTSDAPDDNERTISITVMDSFGNTSTPATATVNITAVNDKPDAADNTLSTDEDTPVAILASAFGYSDPDNDPLAGVRIVTLPAAGSLLNGATPVDAGDDIALADLSGNLSFVPAADEFGAPDPYASFTFRVDDGSELSDASYTIDIDVAAINDAPVLVTNNVLNVTELNTAVISIAVLSASDVDNSDSEITYTVTAAPSFGNLSSTSFTQAQLASNAVTYAHTAAGQTADSFSFDIDDPSGDGPTSLTLDISISQNATPVIVAGGVLDYDEGDEASVIDSTIDITDADGDDLAAAVVTISNNYQPTEDTLACPVGLPAGMSCVLTSADRVDLSSAVSHSMGEYETVLEAITYFNSDDEDPNEGTRTVSFSVTDSFGNTSLAATASVTVTRLNDAPTASDNSVSADEDTDLALLATMFNFDDVDSSDSLQSVRIVSLPAAGSLRVGATPVTAGQDVSVANLAGALVFEPVADANGSPYTSFGFRVNDGTVLSAASYTMTIDIDAVNDAPVLGTNETLVLAEFATAPITTSLLSASDVDDAVTDITYTVTDLPDNGTLSMTSFTQADIVAGNVTYQHTAAATVADAFVFDVDDAAGAGPVAQTFNILISPNLPPVVTAGGNLGYAENQGAVPVDSGLTVSDADGDDIKSATIVISSNYQAEDALDFVAQNGISVQSNAGNTLVLTGTTSLANYQSALRSVTYNNASEDPVEATRIVSFTVTDALDNTSAAATASISVSRANDAPTASDGSISGDEDTDILVPAAAFGYSDLDSGDALSAVRITSLPAAGVLELNGAAVTSDQLIAVGALSGDLIFRAAANAFGASYASFGFRVSDGEAESAQSYTMNIDVLAVDDAPLGANNTLDGVEDTPLPILAAAFGFDDLGDGDNLASVRVISAPTSGSLRLGVNAIANNTDVALADLAGNLNYLPLPDGTGSPYDSFTFRLNDGVQFSDATYTMTLNILPDNDVPEITADTPPAATETEAYSYDVQVTDSDDDNDGTQLSWSFVSAPAGMTISSTGTVAWTPPENYIVDNGATAQFEVRVQDDENATDTQLFTIAVNIPDEDTDGIPDYADNCPDLANNAQEDLDEDGNGDDCDTDIDGDGMPNDFEEANGLDPRDPDDADADPDGDGLTNLDEFLQDKDPNVDDAGPVITVPADIVVDATGLLTDVDLGIATAEDLNDGPVIPTASPLPPYPAGRNIVTWTAIDAIGNTTQQEQIVDVRPLANLALDQLIGEGSTAGVTLTLSGEPPAYPVTLTYTLSGDADDADYSNFGSSIEPVDALVASGLVTINSGTELSFEIDIAADAVLDSGEQLIITLSDPINAAIGNQDSHAITIVERNVAPTVSLDATQANGAALFLYNDQGLITVEASVDDPEDGTITYEWGGDIEILVNGTGWSSVSPVLTIDPTLLIADRAYTVELQVTDDGMPIESASASVSFYLSASASPVLSTEDTDGDGIDDQTEGQGDTDGDGIPDYLDTNDRPELIPLQSVEPDASQVAQAEVGITLRPGPIAINSGNQGIAVSKEDIMAFGGMDPEDEDFENTSGYFSFAMSGLSPLDPTTDIVIPLGTAVAPGAVYRKYDPASGWSDFIVDDLNRIASAPGVLPDACPAPGSDAYVDGLLPFSFCIQLTIEDGGPNDQDGELNGTVIDPGGLAVIKPEASQVSPQQQSALVEGSGMLSPMWLLFILTGGMLRILVMRRHRTDERN